MCIAASITHSTESDPHWDWFRAETNLGLVPFLRASVDRSVPQGAKVTTSEQLQPVYETKNLVQQNSKQLEGIESHLKVGCRSVGC